MGCGPGMDWDPNAARYLARVAASSPWMVTAGGEMTRSRRPPFEPPPGIWNPGLSALVANEPGRENKAPTELDGTTPEARAPVILGGTPRTKSGRGGKRWLRCGFFTKMVTGRWDSHRPTFRIPNAPSRDAPRQT